MTLRILDLCLSFFSTSKYFRWKFQPCPSFFRMQIFQVNEKGISWTWSRWKEGESERKIMNQIFGCLQHPKNEVRYLENIFFRLKKRFFTHKGEFFTKATKANIIAFIKTKIFETCFVCEKPPLHVFWVLHPLKLIFVNSFLRFSNFLGVFERAPAKKKVM